MQTVRMQCQHPGFCPRNAIDGGTFCEEHQPTLTNEELDEELDGLGVMLGAFAAPRPRVHNVRTFTRQALLPFECYNGARTLMAQPQKQFKPRGLMLFGKLDGLNLEASIIGCNEQLLVAFGKVPALWFAQAQSYEQIAKAFADGIEPFSWGSWDALYPGVRVRLEFDRPCDGVQAVMWGLTT